MYLYDTCILKSLTIHFTFVEILAFCCIAATLVGAFIDPERHKTITNDYRLGNITFSHGNVQVLEIIEHQNAPSTSANSALNFASDTLKINTDKLEIISRKKLKHKDELNSYKLKLNRD
jgi:hypothetical protein